MAIFHLSTTPLSRANGRSAVAAAAYRSGSELADVRTGQVFDYTRKGGVMSSEIVTPEGVPVPEREALWNAAEAAERRKDSRIAREWRAALPAELDAEQRHDVAHRWAKEYADRYGVAVDVCIHEPDAGGDERNFHVHMLATTRQIDANGELGAKAAIELGNKDRVKAGISGKTQDDMVDLRGRWAEITNDALEYHGFSERIDHRSYAEQGIDLTPTKHIGVQAVGMDRRGLDTERLAQHEEIRRENAQKIEENPALVVEKITHTQAVFDRRDMAREINRYIDDPDQFQNILARVEQDKQLVQLTPERTTETGRIIPAKYSTQDMIDTERRMVNTAERMADTPTHAVESSHVQAAIAERGTLSDEQRQAVEHVTGPGRMAVVIGDAGTGKSFAMATARDAWEAQGYRVRGAALAGKAADGLQEGSGIESRTLHSLEYGWDQGRDPLTSRDVLVIDEAGMVGSRQLDRVLDRADKAGAKVVMLGDDKQLAAIEAGAGFRAITERTGASEITEIRRQRDSWAREASGEFARGDVRTALDAYQERDQVRMVDSREDAKAAIASDYLADRQMGGSSIILAHSNKDVAGLNQSIRTARAEAGELGPSVQVETSRGNREFSQGDRLMFLKNDRAMDVKNGSLGTVQEAEDGRLSVQLDNGREVAFNPKHYEHFDHGYAATVHKSQGVTVDRAYVLATPGMDRSLAYVGMTRHRESATMYAGGDDFASYDKLAKNLSRERPKESTLDFAERHGVEVDNDQWSVAKLDPERAQALRDAIAQRPAEAAQEATSKAAEPTPERTPRVDFSRLEGAEQVNTAEATTPAEKPILSATQKQMQDRQQGMFAELKAHKAEQAGQADPEARRQKAVQLAVAASKRQAEKAGMTVGAENLQQMEKAAAERLERDPKMVDRVLQMEDVRQQSAGERTAQREAQGSESAAGGRGQKFDFEQLREQNAKAAEKQEQERSQGHERGGPDMER